MGAWEEESELVTAWVALSDVTAEAGPMRYVRGSHSWGPMDEGDFHGSDHAAQKGKISPAGWRGLERGRGHFTPGRPGPSQQAHFARERPNLTDGPRRSFAVHMRTERARPKDGIRAGLTAFIDDESVCPVIYREKGADSPAVIRPAEAAREVAATRRYAAGIRPPDRYPLDFLVGVRMMRKQ